MKKGTAHIKLTIRDENHGFFGPGIAELLERIDETASIKDACTQMGLSYTKGRYILKRAENSLGFPLIEIRHGGSGGGGSTITEKGRKFLRAYREIEADVSAYASDKWASVNG